ncbi:DUF2842 domain-containing protein [Alphaproteobacteria bacterium]|nr:DUF2842 domain-containing protein [Alphaproteobacteria bacterium]MDA9190136.1 DUF2842 domain-containing protein [Alphaproteobacteria bacterium]MDA9815509.1 DUF2842 domain-containing protein [Alphaproteobacteria bacterium]MDC0462276.1 DUF2842 domain-containing protein [Alphaproteobacteria bacterium]MDC3311249.1 DUF2842 domain-containing protein [Alphaproteobacteria bacterium]
MKRWRHLLVAVLVVPALICYVIVAMIFSQWIEGISGIIDFIFYLIAGLAWIPAASIVIKWLADNESH